MWRWLTEDHVNGQWLNEDPGASVWVPRLVFPPHHHHLWVSTVDLILSAHSSAPHYIHLGLFSPSCLFHLTPISGTAFLSFLFVITCITKHLLCTRQCTQSRTYKLSPCQSPCSFCSHSLALAIPYPLECNSCLWCPDQLLSSSHSSALMLLLLRGSPDSLFLALNSLHCSYLCIRGAPLIKNKHLYFSMVPITQ